MLSKRAVEYKSAVDLMAMRDRLHNWTEDSPPLPYLPDQVDGLQCQHDWECWWMLQHISEPGRIDTEHPPQVTDPTPGWRLSLDDYEPLDPEQLLGLGIIPSKFGEVTILRAKDPSGFPPYVILKLTYSNDFHFTPESLAAYAEEVREYCVCLAGAGVWTPDSWAAPLSLESGKVGLQVHQAYIPGPTVLELWKTCLDQEYIPFETLEAIMFAFLSQAKLIIDDYNETYRPKEESSHEADAADGTTDSPRSFSGVDFKPHNYVVTITAEGKIRLVYVDVMPPHRFTAEGKLILHQLGCVPSDLETISKEWRELRCTEHLLSHGFLELIALCKDKTDEILLSRAPYGVQANKVG